MTSAQLNTAPTVQWGEREFSIEDSARRAVSAITEMGLTAQLRYYGGDPTVWRCDLFDDGRPVHAGIGFGKGGIGGARVGALYEAVEHHVTQQRGFAAHTVELRCCGQVAQSVLASEPYAGILAAQPDQLIACRVYRQLGGTDTLAVPLFLSNVWWVEDEAAPMRAARGDTTDYSALARYSSNSGCAIGGSLAEALVHAINEAIERDAMSLFLARTFLAAAPAPPGFLATDTLPPELGDLLERVQSRVGREVWLIDLTSDLGVPTTLAYARGLSGPHLRGCGTSLSRHYSIERALTELLQAALVPPDSGSVNVIERLAAYPVLQAAAAVELDAPTAAVPGVPYIDTPAARSPDQHLHRLLRALASRGFTPYFSRVHAAANGITTVHVHIFGLERFNIVCEGSAVVPGQRALATAHQPAPVTTIPAICSGRTRVLSRIPMRPFVAMHEARVGEHDAQE